MATKVRTPVYEYGETVIAVMPGLGGDNWATCKLKKSGCWTAVKSPDMPRTNQPDIAIDNLNGWAKKKGLRRLDHPEEGRDSDGNG